MPEFNLREYNIDDDSGGSDVPSGADRHLDITFGLQVVEAHPLFQDFLVKHLAIPTSPFFHLLINGFSVTCNNNYHNQALLQTGFLSVY